MLAETRFILLYQDTTAAVYNPIISTPDENLFNVKNLGEAYAVRISRGSSAGMKRPRDRRRLATAMPWRP